MKCDGIVELTLLLNEEKLENKGEDSVLAITNAPNASFIACMDGCGGSGAKRYTKADNMTGARLASMHVGSALKNWFDENEYGYRGTEGKEQQELSTELKNAIDKELSYLRADLGDEDSGVWSRQIRMFPTTLAAVLAEVTGRNTIRCVFFWAGDSRAYLFRASGLNQISRDDIRGNDDPFSVLENDGILSNVISASNDYIINTTEVIVHEPCIILTATDGCFSYLRSPIEFEGVLLASLMNANSPLEWEDSLRTILGRYASDDYTMALAVLGFQNWDAIKNAYAPRWEEYRKQFGEPLEDILQTRDRQAHLELWEIYKQNYM